MFSVVDSIHALPACQRSFGHGFSIHFRSGGSRR
jgi:hypothetical protein